MLYKGANKIIRIFKGSSPITQIYKGIVLVWQYLTTTLFAKYFDEDPIIENNQLRDNTGSGAVATPTIIWAADGTAKFQVTEADYPDMDFDQAVFSYVTDDEVGHTIVGTRSGGIYTAFPPIGNVSRLKLWDVREIQDKLVEVIINGDFSNGSTGWTLKSNSSISNGQLTIDTTIDNDWYANAVNDGSVSSGVTIYSIDIESNNDQLWLFVGNDILTEGTSFNTNGIYEGVLPADLSSKVRLEDRHSNPGTYVVNSISVKQINLTQEDILDLNLEGNQVGVVAQFGFEEGSGEGTNVTVFDRLNDNVFGTIIDNATGATWDTDSTIKSVNHALGYGVADGTEIGGTLEDGVNIPISATNPTQTVLGTVPDYLGKSGYNAALVNQNCVIGDGTAKLTFASLPTYDAITIIADGVETAISLTALEFVLLNGVKYNKAVFKNAGVTVEEFLLNEYDNNLTLPSVYSFYGRYESGGTCVLTNGTDANIGKAVGASGNMLYGYNDVDNGGEITFIPASAITPTKDIAGLDLIHLPNNSTNENNLLYPEVAELIERGDSFNDGVLPLFDIEETANPIPLNQIEGGSELVTVEKADGTNISNITFINEE